MSTKNSKKKRKYPDINVGIKKTPAELDKQAETTSVEFICYYGRKQALIIAKLMVKRLSKIQDEPTEDEKAAQVKRVARLKEQRDEMIKKLSRLEEN